MNTILQKRIEEAAKTSIAETLTSTPNYEFSPKATDMLECAYIKGAEDILKNLWISVEEALPEKRQDVLVAVLDTKSNTYFFGFDNIDDDNGEFLRDKNGFAIENDSHKITHWMAIPSLERGEKRSISNCS